MIDLSAYQRRLSSVFDRKWFSGTIKAGGQKHNKTQTCLRLRHKPTGIVQTAQTRSRENNSKEAFGAIHRTLNDTLVSAELRHLNGVRKAQIGSGQRGAHKRRTFWFRRTRRSTT